MIRFICILLSMQEAAVLDDRSRKGLMEFLDYLANKGLMAGNTAMARKAAANKVLSVLSNEEAADVTGVDLNDVMRRFQNLEGRNYTPGSLTTYQSRTKSALDDFTAYLANPLSFRPSLQARDRNASAKLSSAGSAKTEPSSNGQHQASVNTHSDDVDRALPIRIRSDLTILVHGLPFDLTEAEARKISNVILAYATSE
jgi:hypothetical protein